MSSNGSTISVVIASVNGLPMIDDCLAALADQHGSHDAQVIVADVMGEETINLIKEKYPWVKLLNFPERLTIPQLRSAALALSTGDIIAVIEDHCVVDDHWYEEIVKAHSNYEECVAVGGVVENGSCERLMDWAVFFCEYTPFMQPVAQGISTNITGNNVSYKRRAFQDIDGLQQALNQGFWESTLHSKLLERGDKFLMEPAILVHHKKYFGFRYFISQRFHYSRYYAGTLFGEGPLSKRVLRGAASLVAVPPLVLARMTSQILRKKRHRLKLLQAAPLLVVFTGVWAFGESVGCLFGPGQSLSKIE